MPLSAGDLTNNRADCGTDWLLSDQFLDRTLEKQTVSAFLHVRLLGDFAISLDDTPVTTFDSPRLQSLLAYLLLHRNAPQSRRHIAFLFWPESTEAQAQTNLRNLAFQLRQALPNAENYHQNGTRSLQCRSDDQQSRSFSPAGPGPLWLIALHDA